MAEVAAPVAIIELQCPIARLQRFIESLQHCEPCTKIGIARNAIAPAACRLQAAFGQPDAILRVPDPQGRGAVRKVGVVGPDHGPGDRAGLPCRHLRLSERSQQHEQWQEANDSHNCKVRHTNPVSTVLFQVPVKEFDGS